MTAKQHAQAAHTSVKPAQPLTTGETVGWTVLSLFVITVPLLCLAFAIAVIRFIWKRGSAKTVKIVRPHA